MLWLVIRCAFCPMLLLLLQSPANGTDSSGKYLIGGGVGALKCTRFLNAMAEARGLGGLTSIEGVNRISEWQSYVLGFETAYNYAVSGIRDIFSDFGATPANDVLYGVEPLCQQNPTWLFGKALVVFTEKLHEARK